MVSDLVRGFSKPNPRSPDPSDESRQIRHGEPLQMAERPALIDLNSDPQRAAALLGHPATAGLENAGPDSAALAELARLPALELAPRLIGAMLLLGDVGGVIVETEAYEADDPASHSFSGRTRSNASMFGPALTAHVYRSYGLHWCFNIVCGAVGHGAAVLIRALQPTHGIEAMAARRRTESKRLLCAGPGRLTEALAISDAHDGLRLDAPPFMLLPAVEAMAIAIGPRIGITKAADRPWRFAVAGSPYLSRPLR